MEDLLLGVGDLLLGEGEGSATRGWDMLLGEGVGSDTRGRIYS